MPSLPQLAPDAPQRRPYLVSSRQKRYSALAFWHLLSLDAPSVAALWTYFIARSIDIFLPWKAIAAMFFAVWMIYAADRLLDARLLDALQFETETAPVRELEERHRFHHRHRSSFLVGIVIASLALAALLLSIPHRALELYMLLATLLGAWLLLIHARPHQGVQRLPKELAVGLFFPAAIFIPTVARAPQLQLQLLPIAGLFAATCTLNCLFLYAWEHPPHQRSQSNAHWTTLWAIRHLPHLDIGFLAISLSVITRTHFATLPAIACALSIFLLLLLHTQRRRITPLHLRAAADLVLLTPLLFVFAR